MSTSDSVDRVFVHALATVRRLPRTGSSRPPPSARLRLYGLYKQSMEGNVLDILPRPTLPPPSPSLTTQNTEMPPTPGQQTEGRSGGANNGGNSVHRYASRDLRTREAQAEIEKWDAWHACAGMTRVAAKRAYISTLIETMKAYASGTQESRELVGELEFVWSQISRSASGSASASASASAGGSEGKGSAGGGKRRVDEEGEQESPRRSGIKQMDSFASLPPGRRKEGGDENRMRVLSPVSRGAGSVVEGEDEDVDVDADVEETDLERPVRADGVRDPWRRSIEAHLRHLSTEIAALREQLSSQHLLTSSGYSPYMYQNLSLTWRLWYRFTAWLRWLVLAALRQAMLQVVLVGMVILYGRWRGDRRVENWVRQRWKEVFAKLRRVRFERPQIPYL